MNIGSFYIEMVILGVVGTLLNHTQLEWDMLFNKNIQTHNSMLIMTWNSMKIKMIMKLKTKNLLRIIK
jgi:hypothetical protein